MTSSSKIEITAQILGALIGQNRTRNIEDRDDDVQHAMDLTDELFRRYEDDAPSGSLPGLTPKPAMDVIERDIPRPIIIRRDLSKYRGEEDPNSPSFPPMPKRPR